MATMVLLQCLLSITCSRRLTPVIRHLRQIAAGEGDLPQRLDQSGADEITAIARSFNQFVAKIRAAPRKTSELMGSLEDTGDRVSATADSTNTRMKELRGNSVSIRINPPTTRPSGRGRETHYRSG